MPAKTKKKNVPGSKNPDRLDDIFCTRCGTRLLNIFQPHSFHPENGKQLFTVKSICPNRKHFLDGHSSFWHKIMFYDTVENGLFYEDGTNAS